MKNNVDNALKDVSKNIPVVNPLLGERIYQNALEKNKRNNHFLIKYSFKYLIATMSFVVVIALVLLINFKVITNDSMYNDANSPLIEEVILSSAELKNCSFKANYAYTQEDYDVVSIEINNTGKEQVIYLKEYNYGIVDVVLNNGDVLLEKVLLNGKELHKLTISNNYSHTHYIDIYFAKGVLLSDNQNDFTIDLLACTIEENKLTNYNILLQITNIINFK